MVTILHNSVDISKYLTPQADFLSIGEYYVVGNEKNIQEIKNNTVSINLKKRAIKKVNKKIRNKKNINVLTWYNYYDNVNLRYLDLSLHLIISIIDSLYSTKKIKIVFSSQSLANRYKKKYPYLDNQISFRKKTNTAGKAKDRLILLFRLFIGAVRALLLSGNNRKVDSLVVRSSVYKDIGGAKGDMYASSITDHLKDRGDNVVEITYPHYYALQFSDVWDYARDNRTLSFEGVGAISWLRSLVGANREAMPDHEFENLPFKLRVGIVAARWILNVTSPQKIFIVGEYSQLRKVLVKEARAKGITTVGVQHGVLYDSHPGYTFPPGVLPDVKPHYMFVHGEAYVDVLQRLGYTNDTPAVCMGHPSTQLKCHDTKEKSDGNTEERLVVITSQPMAKWIIRRALLKDVAEDTRKFLKQNVRCIVKLHPNYERKGKFYSSKSKDYLFKSFYVADEHADTAQLLSVADLHISHTSTCLQEAIALGTPSMELLAPPQSYSFSRNFSCVLSKNSIYTTNEHDMLSDIATLLEKKIHESQSAKLKEEGQLFAKDLCVEDALKKISKKAVFNKENDSHC